MSAVTDHGYSPDVEIDHDAIVKASRDLRPGEFIVVPIHLWRMILEQNRAR